jgi:hypothetical protein
MALAHSSKADQSYYDIVLLQQQEQWDSSPGLSWLVADGMTYEVKADEMAFKTGNVFLENGRTDGTPTGLNVTKADRWIHGLGMGAIIATPENLRAGCPRLVSWGQAKELRGGDKNGTTGYAVPALSLLDAPFLPNGIKQPLVFEHEFQARTTMSELLKGSDESMNFKKDVKYGEQAEAYYGALLQSLASTPSKDISQNVCLKRVNGTHGYEQHLQLEFKQNNTLTGIATASGQWIFLFEGIALVMPAPCIKELARKYYHRTHTLHPQKEHVEVVRVPLKELVFCAGPFLPSMEIDFARHSDIFTAPSFG